MSRIKICKNAYNEWIRVLTESTWIDFDIEPTKENIELVKCYCAEEFNLKFR